MKKINELAQLFAKYKIYPKSCYTDCSPAKVFQKKFKENHYSRDLEEFLSYQDYEPTQRGADLPWWGKKFFVKETGFRIMVVGQDTAVEDAGSIVLAAQFFPPDIGPDRYQKFYPEFISEMDMEKYFGPNKLRKITNQFTEWGIDFDFLYMTDASKVYKNGSWEDRDFDKGKSKELLGAEIEHCNPDLIILLGGQPLYLLDNTKSYASVVESGKPILIQGKRCVVAPFFIGNGPTQPNFRKRLETATYLIKEEISRCQRKS